MTFDITELDRAISLAEIAAWLSTQPNTGSTRLHAAVWANVAKVSRVQTLAILDALPPIDDGGWETIRRYIPGWDWPECYAPTKPAVAAVGQKNTFVPPPPEDDEIPF